VIAAAGDIACDPASASFNGGQGTATLCRQQATANLVEAMSPDAVLVLGDSQYDCGGASAYARSFDPSWGAFKSLIHPAVGNHEYTAAVTGGSGCDGTGQAAGYYGYFGAAAGDAGQGYYSFDLGQWHVIALNSNCTKVSCLAGSPQLTWLASDLAAHSVACTLAFWHHPRFSSGLHGDDARFDPFWTTLQAGGADVVLNGHDHDYERFAPQMLPGAAAANGITEFVVGTGGRSRYGFVSTPSSNTVIRSSGTFGVLKMTLSPSSFSWEFVPEPGSAFSDAGSAPCH